MNNTGKTLHARTAAHPLARLALAAPALLMLLAACASTPGPPTQALHAAEQAIALAEQDPIAGGPPPALGEARAKLDAAHSAVLNKQMTMAERLAEQSRLSAELALAHAELQRAEKINDQLRQGNDALEQEMRRNTGKRP